PGKKFAAAIATMHDMEMTLPEFLQPQRHRRHCSHEGRIHHRAMFQIKNKFAIAAIDHLLREFFQAPAVQEVALAFHSHPNGGSARKNRSNSQTFRVGRGSSPREKAGTVFRSELTRPEP